ncbi:MAG: hypothetical protein JJLCMIEE_03507 [Acidimicrobiales bacterium]|nr:MAG: TetR/AcrR family transcriptional regulator [Actinomycetota bacterium]MBV6510367.1 hypothetical protein [Acidimicrobiales bacterium]RIK03204.1 MAG: TetR family transcriptional regulator [Acidobacteriota bacterium]
MDGGTDGGAGRPVRHRSRRTRDRILDAAEKLMVEKGVDGVSLREVNAAAGQRNASAVQYHFGNRDGLLGAIIDRHRAPVETARQALMARHPSVGNSTRQWLECLIEPLTALLADASGRRYLQIIAQLVERPDVGPVSLLAALDERSSARRCIDEMVAGLDRLPAALALQRSELAVSFALSALAEQARRHDAGTDRRLGDPVFSTDLVDVLEAVLTTAPSAETMRELQAAGQAD